MASGSFQTSTVSTSAGFDHPEYMVVEWTSEGNTIDWVLKAGTCDNTENYVTFSNVLLVIGGVTVYSDPTQGQHSYKSDEVIASGSLTVEQGGSVEVSAEAGIYVWAANSTYSGTIELDALVIGPIYIEDGAAFDEYQAFVDNGSGWDRYDFE